MHKDYIKPKAEIVEMDSDAFTLVSMTETPQRERLSFGDPVKDRLSGDAKSGKDGGLWSMPEDGEEGEY